MKSLIARGMRSTAPRHPLARAIIHRLLLAVIF